MGRPANRDFVWRSHRLTRERLNHMQVEVDLVDTAKKCEMPSCEPNISGFVIVQHMWPSIATPNSWHNRRELRGNSLLFVLQGNRRATVLRGQDAVTLALTKCASPAVGLVPSSPIELFHLSPANNTDK
jgi:hypothetical protein